MKSKIPGLKAGYLLLLLLIFIQEAHTSPLEKYLKKNEPDYSWNIIKTEQNEESDLFLLEIISQKWKGSVWTHELAIALPKVLKKTDTCFLFISADKSPLLSRDFISKVAVQSGSPAAFLNRIPNQPLFDGKKEDKLLAYTLKQFIDTGDTEWPILFPMVKSVIKTMDTITAFLKSRNIKTGQFVLSGSSKRGWTAYLTAANDKRVAGIAPLVFDMLNMKKQTDWAKEVYGEQSQKIKNYTELGLVERISEPRTTELRKWIDPFETKDKLTAPKLILIGTNDPYWVVDSQIHYFNELPGNKLIYQVPNGDHHISRDPAVNSNLMYWFSKISSGGKLPLINWQSSGTDKKIFSLTINSDIKITEANLWQADSETRDFRNAVWIKNAAKAEGNKAYIKSALPASGYRAYIGEVVLEDSGQRAVFSTTAFVKNAAGGSL